jgi:NitT/TauT family transport system permease protein
MIRTARRITAFGIQLAKHLLVFAALIALWEGASELGLIDTILVPRPTDIWKGIVNLYITQGTIYWHFGITLYEAAMGFLIGSTMGLLLAMGSALNDNFRRYVSPYATLLNVTPGLALTPIIIAWFGFGYSSKIALGAITCFFPVFVNTLIGLTKVDAETAEMFRSLGASRRDTFLKLQLPAALPIIFAGFKIAVTTALVGAIVAEFSQGTAGIGVLMQRYAFQLNGGAAIASLLSMSLLGLMLFVIIEIIDDRIVFWRRDARMTAVSRKRRRQWSRMLEPETPSENQGRT